MSRDSDKAAVFEGFVDRLTKPFTEAEVASVQAKLGGIAEQMEKLDAQAEALRFVLKMDDIRKNGKPERKRPGPHKAKAKGAASEATGDGRAHNGVTQSREAEVLAYLRRMGPRKPGLIAADLNIPAGSISALLQRMRDSEQIELCGEGYRIPRNTDND